MLLLWIFSLAMATPLGPASVPMSDVANPGVWGDGAYRPAVAWSDTSDVGLVVWEYDASGGVSSPTSVHARLLDRLGRPLGPSVMLGDGRFITDNRDPAEADVAWDPVRDRFLVVWSEDLSAGENEIFTQVVGSDGKPVGDAQQISWMGPDGDERFGARSPGVDYDASRDGFVVVWAGDDAVDDLLQVYGQRVDPAGVPTGDAEVLSGATLVTAREPDVAVDPASGRVVVVWSDAEGSTEGWEIWSWTGVVLSAGDIHLVSDTPARAFGTRRVHAESPRVCRGPNQTFAVVWHAEGAQDFQTDIWARALDALGVPRADRPQKQVTFLDRARDHGLFAWHPDIVWDPATRRYAVAWADNRFLVGAPSERAVVGRALFADLSPDGAVENLSGFGTWNDFDHFAAYPAMTRIRSQGVVWTVFEGFSDEPGDHENEVFGRAWAVPDFPDADLDTVPDDQDLCEGDDANGDSDGDGVCDEPFRLDVSRRLIGGETFTMVARHAPPGSVVVFVVSPYSPLPGFCIPGVCADLFDVEILGNARVDVWGRARLEFELPDRLLGLRMRMQALWSDGTVGEASNVRVKDAQ